MTISRRGGEFGCKNKGEGDINFTTVPALVMMLLILRALVQRLSLLTTFYYLTNIYIFSTFFFLPFTLLSECEEFACRRICLRITFSSETNIS